MNEATNNMNNSFLIIITQNFSQRWLDISKVPMLVTLALFKKELRGKQHFL